MRKYVNGKLYNMTEDDKLRMSRNRKSHSKKYASDSEARIKELEDTVKALSAKLIESEQ